MVMQLNRCSGLTFFDQSWKYGPLERLFGNLKQVFKVPKMNIVRSEKRGREAGPTWGLKAGLLRTASFVADESRLLLVSNHEDKPRTRAAFNLSLLSIARNIFLDNAP
jgi:hypothetical protein